jgi:hypothetical protein
MGVFEFQTSLADASGARSEALIDIVGQKRRVPDRLSLGIQNGFQALGDVFAMCQKKSQQFDVRLKRRLTKRLVRHHSIESIARD